MRHLLLAILFCQLGILEAAGQDLLDHLTRAQNSRSRRVSSTAKEFGGNGDSLEIAPGKSAVLADLQGPGVITHIWFTTASLNPFSGRSLVLRVYWDDAERPSIEVPLGDFFGVGHGAAVNLQSIPVNVSSYGRSRNCYWKMPFRKHAKITLSNEDEERMGPAEVYYYVDWEQPNSLPNDVLYFHARYCQQTPAQPGDHVLLETAGRGHYVGTVYSAHLVQTGWFGEGDDRFYIDGETVPSLQGTGTEDYIGDSWEFREFNGPFQGVSLYEGLMFGDRASAYRWHITDPIRFTKSLKFSIEHRGAKITEEGKQLSSSNERADWISSVAFWYQTPAVTWKEDLPPARARVAPYVVMFAKDLKYQAVPNKTERDTPGILFRPQTPDGKISFDFNVEKAGTYKVSAVLLKSITGGLYQPFLDGKELGNVIDFRSKGYDWEEHVFDIHLLTAGKHTFQLDGRGASPGQRTVGPKWFEAGVSSLILLRMEDMAGFQEKMAEQR